MTAIRQPYVLVAVLLAAATPAVDNAVVAEEILPCSVVSADSGQPYARRLDTLAANTSPAEMAARCRDMEQALRECGRHDRNAAGLLGDIGRERQALRGIWPEETGSTVSGPVCGLLGGVLGGWLGHTINPEYVTTGASWPMGCPAGAAVGSCVGCIVGYPVGVAVSKWRRASLIAQHRGRVNDLISRVNRAIVSQP